MHVRRTGIVERSMACRDEETNAPPRPRYVAIEVTWARLTTEQVAGASLRRREAALRDRIARVQRSLEQARARGGQTTRRGALVLSTVLAAGLGALALTGRSDVSTRANASVARATTASMPMDRVAAVTGRGMRK